MLEIYFYGPSTNEYYVTDGSEPRVISVSADASLHAGGHGKVHLMARPVDFGQVLQNELTRHGRGKLIVSGKHHRLPNPAELTMISVHGFDVKSAVEKIGFFQDGLRRAIPRT